MSWSHRLKIRGITTPLLLLPVLIGCLLPPVSAQQDARALDPSDVFFQAWLEVRKAEKLDKEGKYNAAWQKYNQAAKYYDSLDRFHKNWKPHLVQGRIVSTRASIKIIEPKVAAELAGKKLKTRDLVEAAPLPQPKPTLKPTPPNKLKASGQERLPTHKILPAPAPTIATINPRQQKRLKQLQRDNEKLRKELLKIQNDIQEKNSTEKERLITEQQRDKEKLRKELLKIQNDIQEKNSTEKERLITEQQRDKEKLRKELLKIQNDIQEKNSTEKERFITEQQRDKEKLRQALLKIQNGIEEKRSTEKKRFITEQQRLINLIAKKDREINTIRDLLARAPLQQEMDRVNRENRTRESELAITARALKESQQKLIEAEKISEKHSHEALLAQRRLKQIRKDMEDQKTVDNRVVRELRKELKNVSSLLEKTRHQLGAANSRVTKIQQLLDESHSTLKELTEERDNLRTERDTLATILKKNDSKGIQNLITENMRLGRNLKEALDRLKFLETSQNTSNDDLLQAKSDLAIAKTRILRYQQEQANHGRMITSLETQLRDAQAALNEALANPAQNVSQEEVEILKGTVKRLIAAQERRRMSEKILWETYQKSKTAISGMAAAFKDIRNTKVELTKEEENLVTVRRPDSEFTSPERVSPAHARAHGDALKTEIATHHPLMKRLFEKGRYEAARQILLDMDEQFPGHFPTLCNRGVLELKTNNLTEAAAIFSEAITMRENSSYAHYMLGLVLYKDNDVENARNSFQNSLDLKPGNSRAHLYLGNLAGAGKRYKQAEEHFLTAIQLDPTEANAYFNLSVIYLQQKRKKDALNYYRKALHNGKNPIPSHEQQLSS